MAVTGVRYENIEGYDTVLLIDTEGVPYFFSANLERHTRFVGADWGAETGAPITATPHDEIHIVNEEGLYENPQLIPWLMQFGATFARTYRQVPLTVEDGQQVLNVSTLICSTIPSGLGELIISADVDVAIKPFVQSADDVYSCEMQLIEATGTEDTICVVDISQESGDINLYANACICQALGIDPVYLS